MTGNCFVFCSENVSKDDDGIVHISFGKSTTMRMNRKLSFDEIELAC